MIVTWCQALLVVRMWHWIVMPARFPLFGFIHGLPKQSRDGFIKAGEAQRRMANLSLEDQGAIWVYDARLPFDPSHTSSHLVQLTIIGWNSEWDFHPHGISIHQQVSEKSGSNNDKPNEDQPSWLYVANHARDGDEIVLLEIHSTPHPFPPTLIYRGRMRSPNHLKVIND